MKQKYLIYEIIIFSLVCLFLIIPPFFSKPIYDAALLFNWSFPLSQAGLCAFALVLYFFSRGLNNSSSKKGFFFPSMLALGLLIFISLVIKIITKSTGTAGDALPDSLLKWFFCVLTFLFSAVYEEIIYRFYFTDSLARFIKLNNWNIWLLEAAGALVFAFAHLYLGFAAVINAFFAHIILRFLYKKTNLIWNCVIIHFIYNIISLILL